MDTRSAPDATQRSSKLTCRPEVWTVKEQANHFGVDLFFDGEDAAGHGPEGASGVARMPDALIEDVIEAAEECPGECIMIEPYSESAISNRGV